MSMLSAFERNAVVAVAFTWAIAASAGDVTITSNQATYAVGETAIFRVSDTRPRDMYDGTVVAGDFFLAYDPNAFTFVSILYEKWASPPNVTDLVVLDNANDPPSGSVNVSYVGSTDTDLPEDPSMLFEVSFLAKTAATGSIINLDGGSFPSYVFAAQSVTVDVTPAIPEPSTYALMALGLAAVGVAVRRRAARAS